MSGTFPPPPTVGDVIARVRAFITGQPRRKAAICQAAGLVENTLGRVEAPDWSPSLRTLRAIEALIDPSWTPGAAPPRWRLGTDPAEAQGDASGQQQPSPGP